MGIIRGVRFADPILLLLMGMRSLESVVIPMLIADRVAADLNISNYSHLERQPCRDNNSLEDDMLQSVTSRWAMGYWLASSLPGAVTAILLGGWSDRIGRRFPILLAEFGYIVEAACAMATYHWSLPLEVLIAGSAVEGICGSYPTVLLAVYAHTSDFTSSKQRTSRLLILSLIEYVGVGACSIVAGVMLKTRGVVQTEAVVLGGHVLAILYAFVLLQDSRTHSASDMNTGEESVQANMPVELPAKGTDESKHSYWYSIVKTFRLLLRPWPHRGRLIILLFSFELLVMNYLGISDVSVLYAMHRPLCWPSTTIGYFGAGRYAALVISVLIASPMIRYFQPPDRYVVQASILGIVGYFGMIAFARNTVHMFASIGPVMITGPCIGTMRSMMSKLVPAADHGAVFATIASLETIITVLATVIYNNLYAFLIKMPPISFLPNPGSICFLLAAGLNLLPVLVLGFVPARSPTQSGYIPVP